MLVLSRKPGEQIVLPDYDVTVTVLEVKGDRVRIGISAPDSVGVHRAEVWHRIQTFLPEAGTAQCSHGSTSIHAG